jgi:hypothetical protein
LHDLLRVGEAQLSLSRSETENLFRKRFAKRILQQVQCRAAQPPARSGQNDTMFALLQGFGYMSGEGHLALPF